VQLIWRILLLSRSGALPLVCRALWQTCAKAPRHIKTEFMLCSWLDSYALRFTEGTLADAGIPALASEFVPTSYPPSGTAAPRRAATCDVLSYVARFGICTAAQLVFAQERIIRTRLCGNVCQLHGIFTLDAHGVPALVPVRLACHVVPERVFRSMRLRSAEKELAAAPEAERAHLARILRLVHELVPHELAADDAVVRRPSLDQLELLLRLLLLHHASANSNQGFGLAMAIYMDCAPVACILLACGADPRQKSGIALQIAAKKGSLGALRLLVERDDKLEQEWHTRLRAITHELSALSRLRLHSLHAHASGARTPAVDQAPAKRRRLADRCTLDVSLLRAAVRARAWDLVQYLMEQKKVVPDVATLRMIDQHGV